MPDDVAATLDGWVARIERMSGLDRICDATASVVNRLLPGNRIRDLAAGTPIGHPMHPVTVVAPIGCWLASSYFDLGGRRSAVAARRLIGLGNVTAVAAAVTGSHDWLSTAGAERRVGIVHAAGNVSALGLCSASWLARRKGRRGKGMLFSLAGATAALGSAWLGGHLAYALGVGVDTTAFQHAATDWTDCLPEQEVRAGELVHADVGGVPVMLTRHGGAVVALADRCTHRGGPLHNGQLTDGCVVCPWHGSRFRLPDGAVDGGPATRPAPRYETRVVDGVAQIRRDEPRTLRTRPVGV